MRTSRVRWLKAVHILYTVIYAGLSNSTEMNVILHITTEGLSTYEALTIVFTNSCHIYIASDNTCAEVSSNAKAVSNCDWICENLP